MKLLLTGLLLTLSLSVFANETDCKLLKGVAITSKVLTVANSGYGDMDYHIRAFEILRDEGNKLSRVLNDEIVAELSSKKLKEAVISIASNLMNSTQNGVGDVYYWAKLVSVKRQELNNASNSLNDLANIVCE